MATKYVVVENAGYERECDVRTFDNFGKASAFVERQYTTGERENEGDESLHVGIRADYDDGSCEFIG